MNWWGNGDRLLVWLRGWRMGGSRLFTRSPNDDGTWMYRLYWGATLRQLVVSERRDGVELGKLQRLELVLIWV